MADSVMLEINLSLVKTSKKILNWHQYRSEDNGNPNNNIQGI